jgi:hypothetical protein
MALEEKGEGMSRTYKVVLKDKTELNIRADDVEVECCDASTGEDSSEHHPSVHFYNFLIDIDDDDLDRSQTSVAYVPYEQVLYINS